MSDSSSRHKHRSHSRRHHHKSSSKRSRNPSATPEAVADPISANFRSELASLVKAEVKSATGHELSKIKNFDIPPFERKGNEQQFKFNAGIVDSLLELKDILKKYKFPREEDVYGKLKSVIGNVQERQKMIKLADSSVAGWKTIEFLGKTASADSKELKKFREAEAMALESSKRARAAKAYGSGGARFSPYLRPQQFFQAAGPASFGAGPVSSIAYRAPYTAFTTQSFAGPSGTGPATNPHKFSKPCLGCGLFGHWRAQCPFGQLALMQQQPKAILPGHIASFSGAQSGPPGTSGTQ